MNFGVIIGGCKSQHFCHFHAIWRVGMGRATPCTRNCSNRTIERHHFQEIAGKLLDSMASRIHGFTQFGSDIRIRASQMSTNFLSPIRQEEGGRSRILYQGRQSWLGQVKRWISQKDFARGFDVLRESCLLKGPALLGRGTSKQSHYENLIVPSAELLSRSLFASSIDAGSCSHRVREEPT